MRSAMPFSPRLSAKVLGAMLFGAMPLGCKSEPNQRPVPTATAPDRLRPDETALKTETAFGIPIPRELKVQTRFLKSVFLAGNARSSDLIEYFRGHVLVDHLEVSGTETIFPRARIKGAQDGRTYRIRISTVSEQRSAVIIEDITPPPTERGLTPAQRYERVGLNPDGTLKDRLQLK